MYKYIRQRIMMSTKLTLYIEDDLISYIKTYAKENRQSVSKVVNNFFTLLQQESKEQESAPITKSLRGVLDKGALDISDYEAYLEKKYL